MHVATSNDRRAGYRRMQPDPKEETTGFLAWFPERGYGLFLLPAGTGANSWQMQTYHDYFTHRNVELYPAQPPVARIATVETAPSVSPAEMLSLVRTAWGLNVTQAASVFRVERPTIYLWAGLQDHSRVRPQNRNRMMQLYRLAREWSQMGRLPNAALEAVFDGYPTLLEMLSAEQLDSQAILGSHARLSSNRPQIDVRSNEQAVTYGKVLSSAFKSMGRHSPGKGGDPV